LSLVKAGRAPLAHSQRVVDRRGSRREADGPEQRRGAPGAASMIWRVYSVRPSVSFFCPGGENGGDVEVTFYSLPNFLQPPPPSISGGGQGLGVFFPRFFFFFPGWVFWGRTGARGRETLRRETRWPTAGQETRRKRPRWRGAFCRGRALIPPTQRRARSWPSVTSPAAPPSAVTGGRCVDVFQHIGLRVADPCARPAL